MLPKSLQCLLSHIIDYAGIYPPAALSLQESYSNYLSYREGDANWIVRHFVCPAARLKELPPRPEIEDAVPVCVIGSQNDNQESFQLAVENDRRSMESFTKEKTGYILQTYEIKVPESFIRDLDLQRLSGIVVERMERLPIYLEIPFVQDWQTNVPIAIQSLTNELSIFPKIRTGGITAEAFPSSEQVATFLEACASSQTKFKATAGLHHPLRDFDETIGCMMHGFLNIALAFALCLNQKISGNTLVEVIEEKSQTMFGFDDEKVSWQGINLNLDEIEWSRQMFGSFGSCSVEEPLQDLRNLGFF